MRDLYQGSERHTLALGLVSCSLPTRCREGIEIHCLQHRCELIRGGSSPLSRSRISHTFSRSSAHSFASPLNCSSGGRTCHQRCSVSAEACFSSKSLVSIGRGRRNSEKIRTSTGNGAVRASRADSTLEAGATERKSTEKTISGPSLESHLDLLERFTSESSGNNGGRTIAEQLESQVDDEQAEEVSMPLAQNVTLEAASLTIHQKRNIRRQKYLNEVAKRNDAPFFTTVALIVILPPSVILGVAVATGYVQLFP